MEQIKHSFIATNGINMHVAELGTGPVAVFVHGFPEVWYSWRYQMVAFAEAGYRAVALDLRGYGLTINTDPAKNSISDLVVDILGLLDALVGPSGKAVLIGKDFGAAIVYDMASLHPDRVEAVMVLGVPYAKPHLRPFTFLMLPDGHYVKRWGGETERTKADFARFDTKTVLKRIYILFCHSAMPLAAPQQEILDLVDESCSLPDWLLEQDLDTYASLYNSSGFSYPLDVPYGHLARIAKDHGLAKEGSQGPDSIQAPTLLVLGGRDYVLAFPNFSVENVEAGMKSSIPNLEVALIDEGSHFVQEQFPDNVNNLLLNFLSKRVQS